MLDSFEFKMFLTIIIAFVITYFMQLHQKIKEKTTQDKFDLTIKTLQKRSKNGQ